MQMRSIFATPCRASHRAPLRLRARARLRACTSLRACVSMRASSWLCACVLLCACLSLSTCSSKKSPPNIILLTLDTTRADHLGCYGHASAATPHLDRLAREGVRFADARTPIPITLPSHTSLLTGTYPITNGVHQHTDPFTRSDIPTLAEILKQHGYQTAAFVSAKVLEASFGLNRGFDVYDDETIDHPDGSAGHEQRAEAAVAKARRWMESKPAGPYFVWLHFFDPHLSYSPPEPYNSRFQKAPYDGEIAYMDAQIGAFLEEVVPKKELQNAIVIAVGDHGESLGEHGLIGHTEFVYREVLWVPFLIAWPGKIDAGRTVNELVRTIDLMPTVLDLLGVDIPGTVEGRSLRPLIEGKNESQARTSYFESRYLENLFGWAPLLGMERAPHKLIRGARSELYDRSADPHETRNLYQEGDAVSGEMDGLLDALLSEHENAAASAGEEQIDDRTREALASLGYVSSKSVARPAGSTLQDPLEHLQAVALYQKIQLGPQEQSSRGEMNIARRLAELEPDLPAVLKLYGDYLYKFEQLDEAEAAYQKASAVAPEDPAPVIQLAALARVRKNDARERELLERALRIAPTDARALYEMADWAARQKQAETAIAYYEKALVQDPRYLEAMSGAAAQYIALGRTAEAERVLRGSFALHQKNNAELARRHYLLGRALHKSSDRKNEALDHLEQAARLAPTMPGPYYYLAVLYDEMGRGQQAVMRASTYLKLSPPNDPGVARMKAIAGQP